jgi:8-oxo-dGTP pyrophosphatase MutT (NUDIX family)
MDHAAADDVLVDQPESWPVHESEDIYRGSAPFAVRQDLVSAPGSDTRFWRLVLEHPGAVVILAVDDEERALVLKQYRHPAGLRFVELPAGLLDGGDEDPLAVAVRELREEAELQAEEWTHLTSLYPSPGISAEVHHLFLARGLSAAHRGDFLLEHEEADMQVGWVPFADLLEAVVAGALTDAPLVACVLLARARGLT